MALRLASALTLFVVQLLTVVPALAIPTYSITDLGTLGGTSSEAYGINNGGQVVGLAEIAGEYSRAFLYSGGPLIDLGTLGGSASSAYGINDGGQVVGWALNASGATCACLWEAGVPYGLNALIPAGGDWALGIARDINERGVHLRLRHHRWDDARLPADLHW
jgi:probable HAF family extracellular repeat protein